MCISTSSLHASLLGAALLLTGSISSAQLSPPVVLPGDLAPGSSAGVENAPVICRGGDQYLAVWEDSRSELTGIVDDGGYTPWKTDIYAARFDADGNQIDETAILVSSHTWSQEKPEVGWNGSAWLVAWEGRRVTSSWHSVGIYAARVSAAGELLDETPLLIDDRDDVDEADPVVAGDGQNWAVLWSDFNELKTKRTIAGTLVHPDGFVEPAQKLFAKADYTYYPTHLSLAFVGGTYLMVSEHSHKTKSGYTFGQFFDPALTKIGDEFKLSDYGGSYLAASDTGYYVLWDTNWDVRGTPVTAAGQVLKPNGVVLFTYGHLTPDKVTASWNGLGWLATYEDLNVPNDETHLYAVDVDTAGNKTGGPHFIQGHDGHVRDSVSGGGAGNPGDSFILWFDSQDSEFDLFQSQYSAGGTVGTAAPMRNSAPAQTHPDIAGDSTSGYIVAFQSETGSESRILVQRLDVSGSPVDPEPIEIVSRKAQRVRNPAVAWDGTRFLVTWEHWNPKAHPNSAVIRAKRVAPDGTVLDAAPIDVVGGQTPSVAALDSEFLVVASYEPVDHSRGIRRMRVDGATGALLDSMPVYVSYGYAVHPDVAALGDRWLVAWQAHSTHDDPSSKIGAAFVGPNGGPETPFPAENAPDTTRHPSLSAIGDVGIISFNDRFDLRARRIHADGTFLDVQEGFFVNTGPDDQFQSAIGSDGIGFVTAWTDFRANEASYEPGLGDVYAARVDADGTVQDPDGVAVGEDRFLPEGNAAVAGGDGIGIIAYADLLPEAPYSTYRIVLRRFGAEDPVGTSYCGPANLNSTGLPAVITGSGSEVASQNFLTLTSNQMPPNQFGYFLASDTQGFVANPGGSQGNLCLGGQIARYSKSILSTGAGGAFSMAVDLSSIPTQPPHTVVAGETWNFQTWFRDKNPLQTSNFTDGLTITFQ